MSQWPCSHVSDHRRLQLNLQEITAGDFARACQSGETPEDDLTAFDGYLALLEIHGQPAVNEGPSERRLTRFAEHLEATGKIVGQNLAKNPDIVQLLADDSDFDGLVGAIPVLGVSETTSWLGLFETFALAWSRFEQASFAKNFGFKPSETLEACRAPLKALLTRAHALGLEWGLASVERKDGDLHDADACELVDLILGTHLLYRAGFLEDSVLKGPFVKLLDEVIKRIKAELADERVDAQTALEFLPHILTSHLICFADIGETYEGIAKRLNLPVREDPEAMVAAARPVQRARRLGVKHLLGTKGSSTDAGVVIAKVPPLSVPVPGPGSRPRDQGVRSCAVSEFLDELRANFVNEKDVVEREQRLAAGERAAKEAHILRLQAEHDQQLFQQLCQRLITELPKKMRYAARTDAPFISLLRLLPNGLQGDGLLLYHCSDAHIELQDDDSKLRVAHNEVYESRSGHCLEKRYLELHRVVHQWGERNRILHPWWGFDVKKVSASMLERDQVFYEKDNQRYLWCEEKQGLVPDFMGRALEFVRGAGLPVKVLGRFENKHDVPTVGELILALDVPELLRATNNGASTFSMSHLSAGVPNSLVRT